MQVHNQILLIKYVDYQKIKCFIFKKQINQGNLRKETTQTILDIYCKKL